MINLYIYLSNEKKPYFSKEAEKLVKIQIENSLHLGWGKEDILLVTNFDYEYLGIKATKIDSDLCWNPKANKIWAIVYMFDNDMINDNMFFHDLDAFQLYPFFNTPNDVGQIDLAFPNYGHREKYNTGIIFFSSQSKDIFKDLKTFMIKNKSRDEEEGLMDMFDMGKNKKYTNRFKILDIKYNVGKHYTEKKFIEAKTPMIIHFHPEKQRNYNFYCLGENELKKPLINKDLIKLIEKHCLY
jgi:hypothetical protein